MSSNLSLFADVALFHFRRTRSRKFAMSGTRQWKRVDPIAGPFLNRESGNRAFPAYQPERTGGPEVSRSKRLRVDVQDRLAPRRSCRDPDTPTPFPPFR